jgi:hypothetical protein
VVVGSALASVYDPIYGTQRTDYIGNDQHVHELVLTNKNWDTADLNALTGAPDVAVGSALADLYDPIYNALRMTYMATDQHVHELILVRAGWITADLNAITAGAPDAEMESGLSDVYDPIYDALRTDYVATDQHVDELILTGGHWITADLNALTGAPDVAFGSTVTTLYDPIYGAVRIDYIATDQHVHELILSGGNWVTADLNTLSGGPPAALIGYGLAPSSPAKEYVYVDGRAIAIESQP